PLFIRASIDHRPGPAMSKKVTVINCAYSERISCKTAQNPTCGGTGGRGKGDVPKYNGILVDNMATSISMIKGTAMSRVSKPAIKRIPPTISSTPSKVAVACGAGNPSLVKRPTP